MKTQDTFSCLVEKDLPWSASSLEKHFRTHQANPIADLSSGTTTTFFIRLIWSPWSESGFRFLRYYLDLTKIGISAQNHHTSKCAVSAEPKIKLFSGLHLGNFTPRAQACL